MRLFLSFFIFLITLFSHSGLAQTHKRVNHLHGTRTINGINVKVNVIGAVDSLYYCEGDATPYFVGYDPLTSASGNGRVIFHFSKPITDVIINFSGTSDINGHYEEVMIYVNGKHHRLHSPGRKNACEELALVNEKGNVVGCKDCSVSGWNGTKIKGPITTLMIVDTVISGEPNGTVFSLFMGEAYVEPVDTHHTNITNTLTNYAYHLSEGSAGKEMVIESMQLENSDVILKDQQGNFIPLHFQVIEKNRVVIDISDLPKGEYILEFDLNGVKESQRFIIS
jgi:hypothetical protein